MYHGPEGLRNIAGRIHALAKVAHRELVAAGYVTGCGDKTAFFDTFTVDVSSKGFTAAQVQENAVQASANVRVISETVVGISMGEGITRDDIRSLLTCAFKINDPNVSASSAEVKDVNESYRRDGDILTHPIFRRHHSETQMLRYLKTLENRDLALNHSMISLGSCTMKLNATSEMIPVTWPEFCNIHPFVPHDQVTGYHEMIRDLNTDLSVITGFDAVSAQPNSGATGEYAGLLAITNYLESIGQSHRNVCLIPKSAHGTNPASAVMAGMKVVVIENDNEGNIDFDDLTAKIAKHRDNLSSIMITYPSTFGVFEERIVEIIDAVHNAGGQVYVDGVNMNAQVGLTCPGFIGADVCHLNLHKTFCIPHGGGGPGTSFRGDVCFCCNIPVLTVTNCLSKLTHRVSPLRESIRRRFYWSCSSSRTIFTRTFSGSGSGWFIVRIRFVRPKNHGCGDRSSLWFGGHTAHFLHVHKNAGRHRAKGGDQSRHSECQLYGCSIKGCVRCSIHRKEWAVRPRVYS